MGRLSLGPHEMSSLVVTSLMISFLVMLLNGAAVKAGRTALKPVEDDGSGWSQSTADKEVKKDIMEFLKAFDREEGDLKKIAKEFEKSLVKDTGIRKLGVWGINLARIYDLPPSDKKQVYRRMKKNAETIMDSFRRTRSYIEDRDMVGWPMYVARSDKKPSFEAFNSGHLATAVCHAARAAAENGDNKQAAKWASELADYFYDNYLTDDPEKTKLDSKGWVVYVPSGASKERAQRHKKATEQSYCLDVPQAYNHGILAARAAIACDQAIDAIDWDKGDWDSESGWTRSEAQKKLRNFIEKSGKLLLGDMKKASGKNRVVGKGDHYEWQYRDVSKCARDRGTYKDRFEDIAHGTYETNFFVEFKEWGGSVSDEDMHRFVRTFLNRIVSDPGAKGGERFACDVAGTTEDSKKGNPYWPKKNCNNSRELWKRVIHAPLWLSSAFSLRDKMNDKSIRCDIYAMMETVLPMIMDDKSSDFDKHFKEMDSHWGSHAIQAKYYFYNFHAGLKKEC